MKVWLSRTLAWPLMLVGIAVVLFQNFVVVFWVGQSFRRIPAHLQSRPLLLSVFAVELLVDILMVSLIARAISRGREPSRPAALLFLWQGVKVTLSFFYVASVFGHFPFPHWL